MKNIRDGILIIGGYGTVGRIIATELAPEHSRRLIIAGRNEGKARQFAEELGSTVRYRTIDLSGPLDYEQILSDVQWVVMCLDLPQIEFVQACFQRGIHYMDITAEYSILSAIESLGDIAEQYGATAILSVGLVPGLSNLMARHSLQHIDAIEHFDIALLGGMGEKHGTGASEWVLGHFTDGKGMKRFPFGESYNERPTYQFEFSDQHTLPQTLPIRQASTWLGFDSHLMTHLIGFARFPIFRSLFQHTLMQNFLLYLTQNLRFGSDYFVLTTQAERENDHYQMWLSGRSEARVTGLVTAEVLRQMMTKHPSAGVFHIEQLIELADILPFLESSGVVISSSNGETL